MLIIYKFIMTPKEKARELVDKIQEGLWRDRAVNICQEDAVYSALIAVDEIIKDRERLEDAFFYNGNYWNKVKKEIEDL